MKMSLQTSCLFIIVLFLACCLVEDAVSQKKDPLRRALDRARNLERLNKYGDALKIHMDLFQKHPDNLLESQQEPF